MNKKNQILFVVFLVIYSCNYHQGSVINTERNKSEKNYSVERKKIKEFLLDDETSYMIDYIQFKDDQYNKLLFVNSFNNSIYFYNYDESSFEKRIIYEKEGQDGVSQLQAFLYLNDDSIFVYSYSTNILSLTNSDHRVLERYKLYEAPIELPEIILPSPYVQTSTPLRMINEHIVCMGFVPGETNYEDEKNRPVACFINIKDKAMKYSVFYPEQYSMYNWGGGFTYRMPYYDVNDNDELIVSFAADHNVQVYPIHENVATDYYAGSNEIDKILSFPNPKDSHIDEDKAWQWYMTNSSYQNILYDKYRKLYYRIARLPKRDYKLSEIGNDKPIKIIILNNNLKYQGEVKLDEKTSYVLNNCFVTEEGLNIQVRTDDEDMLTFYVYSIYEKEK